MSGDADIVLEFSLIFGPNPLAQAEIADLEADLGCLARFVLATEGATGEWEIVTALITDAELQAQQVRFMDVDEPTDIMTFPYGDEAQGGDLAISVDHATARAAEWNHSPVDEIRFLVAHGALHLLGWRDDSSEQRTAMLERQAALIQDWRAASATS